MGIEIIVEVFFIIHLTKKQNLWVKNYSSC